MSHPSHPRSQPLLPRMIIGARMTFTLAVVLTLCLIAFGAAAAPGVLFGLRAHSAERLVYASLGAGVFSLFICPLLLLTMALLTGASGRVGRQVWGRALFAFPSATLSGYVLVTLLLLNYTPIIFFALGGATICAVLFAWGNLIIIRYTLTPVLMPSAALLPPNEADRC
jgi:hypothetical protein